MPWTVILARKSESGGKSVISTTTYRSRRIAAEMVSANTRAGVSIHRDQARQEYTVYVS